MSKRGKELIKWRPGPADTTVQPGQRKEFKSFYKDPIVMRKTVNDLYLSIEDLKTQKQQEVH